MPWMLKRKINTYRKVRVYSIHTLEGEWIHIRGHKYIGGRRHVHIGGQRYFGGQVQTREYVHTGGRTYSSRQHPWSRSVGNAWMSRTMTRLEFRGWRWYLSLEDNNNTLENIMPLGHKNFRQGSEYEWQW